MIVSVYTILAPGLSTGLQLNVEDLHIEDEQVDADELCMRLTEALRRADSLSAENRNFRSLRIDYCDGTQTHWLNGQHHPLDSIPSAVMRFKGIQKQHLVLTLNPAPIPPPLRKHATAQLFSENDPDQIVTGEAKMSEQDRKASKGESVILEWWPKNIETFSQLGMNPPVLNRGHPMNKTEPPEICFEIIISELFRMFKVTTNYLNEKDRFARIKASMAMMIFKVASDHGLQDIPSTEVIQESVASYAFRARRPHVRGGKKPPNPPVILQVGPLDIAKASVLAYLGPKQGDSFASSEIFSDEELFSSPFVSRKNSQENSSDTDAECKKSPGSKVDADKAPTIKRLASTTKSDAGGNVAAKRLSESPVSETKNTSGANNAPVVKHLSSSTKENVSESKSNAASKQKEGKTTKADENSTTAKVSRRSSEKVKPLKDSTAASSTVTVQRLPSEGDSKKPKKKKASKADEVETEDEDEETKKQSNKYDTAKSKSDNDDDDGDDGDDDEEDGDGEEGDEDDGNDDDNNDDDDDEEEEDDDDDDDDNDRVEYKPPARRTSKTKATTPATVTSKKKRGTEENDAGSASRKKKPSKPVTKNKKVSQEPGDRVSKRSRGTK